MRSKLLQMFEAWCACIVITTSLQELWPEYSMELPVHVIQLKSGVDADFGEPTSIPISN